MYRSILLCASLAFVLSASAQIAVHQVFALSEGYFDFGANQQVIPVTLGVYDPVTGAYQTVATITGPRFGSDVLVNEGAVYVAADDRIVKYSTDSYAELDMALVTGVRKLAVWNDVLLLTRGELGGLDHYFEARDKNTLDLLWSIDPADGLTSSAEDVLVIGDIAYLAVNNAFDWANLTGKVGQVDLNTHTYGTEVDLGPNGLNPEKLFLVNGTIYTFNNTDFSKSSISSVDPQVSALVATTDVTSNSSCAASVSAAGHIYFMEYAQNELARYSISSNSVVDTLAGSPAVYGMVDDELNSLIYATTTDFQSTGDIVILDLNGTITSTIPATVSIGNLALDVRITTGINEIAQGQLGVYPNPATDVITLQLSNISSTQNYVVLDATGRNVITGSLNGSTQVTFSVAELAAGVYTVKVHDLAPVRFTKK